MLIRTFTPGHSKLDNRATATQSLQQIPSRATRSHDIFVFHQRRDGTLVSSVDYLSEGSIPQNPFRPIMSLIIEVIAGSRYRASMAQRFPTPTRCFSISCAKFVLEICWARRRRGHRTSQPDREMQLMLMGCGDNAHHVRSRSLLLSSLTGPRSAYFSLSC